MLNELLIHLHFSRKLLIFVNNDFGLLDGNLLTIFLTFLTTWKTYE